MGVIYLITSPILDAIKIGYHGGEDQHLWKRYQTALGPDMSVQVWNAEKTQELMVHDKFQSRRLYPRSELYYKTYMDEFTEHLNTLFGEVRVIDMKVVGNVPVPTRVKIMLHNLNVRGKKPSDKSIQKYGLVLQHGSWLATDFTQAHKQTTRPRKTKSGVQYVWWHSKMRKWCVQPPGCRVIARCIQLDDAKRYLREHMDTNSVVSLSV